jgi:DNA-binding CsgD family transcriptional regulator
VTTRESAPRGVDAAGLAARIGRTVAASEPAFAVDGVGRVVYWSSAAERFFGQRAADVVGKQCGDAVRARCATGEACASHCVVHTDLFSPSSSGQSHRDIEVITESGVKYVTVQTFQLAVGATPVLVHLLRDTTPLHRVVVTARRLASAIEDLAPPTVRNAAEPSLTAREREALARLAEGLSPAATASRMGISSKTVARHLENAMVKLGSHSRVEAIAVARRLGLVD